MNEQFILQKDHLPGFLRKLTKDYRLVAPVRNAHGDTLFAGIPSMENCAMDLARQPQNSVKPFLFPQQETLLTYRAQAPDHYEFFPVDNRPPPTVYFGIRSCDLSAILYMDVIFSRNFKDAPYLNRRKETILIGLNCNEPFTNCFCNAVHSGPFLEFGSDLQLTDLGDRYYVEPGRASGAAIIKRWNQFFQPAADQDTKIQYQVFLEARGGFKRQVHADQAMKRLAQGTVEERVWTELSLRCQDCGGCAYICPTCTCFTIIDRPLSATHGERLRCWDACTFAGFTGMAGGHNPVNSKTEAIRQRFLHKLCYDVREHGRPSCVGCGRCLGICFGGTDIVRFIELAGEGG